VFPTLSEQVSAVFLDDEIAYECQRQVHAKQIDLMTAADRITRICELPKKFID
jgi:hypothetical protein